MGADEEKKKSLIEKEKNLLGALKRETIEIKNELSLDGDLEENDASFVEFEQKQGKTYESKEKKEQDVPSDILDSNIKKIISRALELKATEVHIDEVEEIARIRYRVDGKLIKENLQRSVKHNALTKRIKMMAEFFIRDAQMIQKGDVLYKINSGEEITIKVNSLTTISGELIVIKFTHKRKNCKIVDLGMTYEDIRTVDRILEKRSGLVLIGGLAGSGRTTTVYAIINKLISNDLNILQIENKIHEKIKGISQISLDDSTNDKKIDIINNVEDFGVDVIIIDANIDSEIMKKLVNLSLGGKLVIVTSYFPTVYDTIFGLTSLGIELYTIAASIEGVMCQHLIRRLCSACKNKKTEDIASSHCEVCDGKGYYGKLAIFETFKMRKEYWQLILRKEKQEILKKFLEKERCSFARNAKRLVDGELTSIEEIVRLGVMPKTLNEK